MLHLTTEKFDINFQHFLFKIKCENKDQTNSVKIPTLKI